MAFSRLSLGTLDFTAGPDAAVRIGPQEDVSATTNSELVLFGGRILSVRGMLLMTGMAADGDTWMSAPALTITRCGSPLNCTEPTSATNPPAAAAGDDVRSTGPSTAGDVMLFSTTVYQE